MTSPRNPSDTDTLTIGELARRTGLSVRTIRFYCDSGILETHRSDGGHRRFDAAATEQLILVKRLRILGMGLPAITMVLSGKSSLDETIRAERVALAEEMEKLEWRRASLAAIEGAAPSRRAQRLELLATAHEGGVAYDAMVSFWRSLVSVPTTTEVLDMYLGMCVVEPPASPVPTQVVAYAGMLALTDRAFKTALTKDGMADKLVRNGDELLGEITHACELAAPLSATGVEPRPGPELDTYVAAYAHPQGRRDTPAYRRELLADTAIFGDPRLGSYKNLAATAVIAGHGPLDPHSWLHRALVLSAATQ